MRLWFYRALALLWFYREYVLGGILALRKFLRRKKRNTEVFSMSGKFGIANLLIMVAVVGRTTTLVDKVAENGIEPSDFRFLPEGYAALAPLLDVKYGELLNEVKDLQADERELLAAKFVETFDLRSDNTELIIEEGVELLLEGAHTVKDLYNRVVAYIETVKGFKAKFA